MGRGRKLEFTISWSTLLKLAAFAAILVLAVQLLHFIALLFVALLIAITMKPLADRTDRMGAPRWVGIFLCAFILLGSATAFCLVVAPILGEQISGLIKTLPVFKDHLLERLPKDATSRELVAQMLNSPSFTNPEPLLKSFLAYGAMAVRAMIEFFVVLIVAIYLVADGSRVYAWLVAFLPERQRQRVANASEEAAGVAFSYMAGQAITSLLCGLYIWGMLVFLKVPNAMLLAVIGGILDVLPLIGFFLALAPAMAMAATVSPRTALFVAAAYTGYHLLENYVIVPRVYGDRLRLSTLTVFVACLAAGMVGGVLCVIIVLPVIASYPIFERTWLTHVVGRETVSTHEAIDAEAHSAGSS